MKRTGDGRESLGKEWIVCWYAGALVGDIIDMDWDFLPAAQNDHWQEGNPVMPALCASPVRDTIP